MSNITNARRLEPALCGGRYHPIHSCEDCQRIYIRNKYRSTQKRTMPNKAVGPACPECGSTQSRSLTRGWSEPDDHFLRRRRCVGCMEVFATAEVVLSGASFYRLDYHGRGLRREYWRTKHSKTDIRMPPYRSDLLEIKVRVVPREQPDVCSRGHKFTPDNTYVNPNSGYRSCRTCRRVRQRRYYEERLAA